MIAPKARPSSYPGGTAGKEKLVSPHVLLLGSRSLEISTRDTTRGYRSGQPVGRLKDKRSPNLQSTEMQGPGSSHATRRDCKTEKTRINRIVSNCHNLDTNTNHFIHKRQQEGPVKPGSDSGDGGSQHDADADADDDNEDADNDDDDDDDDDDVYYDACDDDDDDVYYDACDVRQTERVADVSNQEHCQGSARCADDERGDLESLSFSSGGQASNHRDVGDGSYDPDKTEVKQVIGTAEGHLTQPNLSDADDDNDDADDDDACGVRQTEREADVSNQEHLPRNC